MRCSRGGAFVWAQGYGGATARTIYRAGSVTKLFTAAVAVQAAERGELDLDEPVSDWVPEFVPYRLDTPDVSLRLLLGHRAGLPREPARGSYFAAPGVSMLDAVASLDADDLIYAPGERFKYSNAGVTVAGLAVARRLGGRFEDLVEERLLQPLALDDTSLDRDLGIGPAVGLRTSAVDLARFAGTWFSAPESGSSLSPAGWRSMWAGTETVGLGFFLGELDGELRIGHDGDAFGASAVVAALPERGVAVAVLANTGGSVAVLDRLATRALRWSLVARHGNVLEPEVVPQPLDPETARQLAGRYGDQDFWVDLREERASWSPR